MGPLPSAELNGILNIGNNNKWPIYYCHLSMQPAKCVEVNWILNIGHNKNWPLSIYIYTESLSNEIKEMGRIEWHCEHRPHQ